MKEIGRRRFLELSALGIGTLTFRNIIERLDLTTPSLPEKEISRGQGVLFIMLNSFKANEIETFENAIGHRVHGLSYFADFDKELPSFNAISKTFLSGREVMINLMPRKTDNPADESLFCANNFLAGIHDKAIKDAADTFSAFSDKIIYIRFGFEMNGGWFSWGGKPEEYKVMYRYIADKMREDGVDNIKWIFSPNSFPSPHEIKAYYPGDDYVDLVGTDFYEKDIWSYLSPESAFNRSNYYLKSMAPGKPLIVGEIGAAGPGRDKWLADAIYKNLKQGANIINYFQIDKERNWKLEEASEIPVVRSLMASGAFLDNNATLDKINSTIMKVN